MWNSNIPCEVGYGKYDPTRSNGSKLNVLFSAWARRSSRSPKGMGHLGLRAPWGPLAHGPNGPNRANGPIVAPNGPIGPLGPMGCPVACQRTVSRKPIIGKTCSDTITYSMMV